VAPAIRGTKNDIEGKTIQSAWWSPVERRKYAPTSTGGTGQFKGGLTGEGERQKVVKESMEKCCHIELNKRRRRGATGRVGGSVGTKLKPRRSPPERPATKSKERETRLNKRLQCRWITGTPTRPFHHAVLSRQLLRKGKTGGKVTS